MNIVNRKRIYLDYAATSPVRSEVVRAMMPYFNQNFGNASSLHSYGREAAAALKMSRETISRIINANPNEIVFTSGGTESDNLAIKGVAYANREKGNHLITSSIEHSAVLNTMKELEKEGFKITYLKVDKTGKVDPADVEKAITSKTILISIMHANNEIGTIQPIKEIGRIARKKGVLFHIDAVQTFTKLPIDVKRMNIDLLSASSHKIGGPKGVGFLFVRNMVQLKPLFEGGAHEFHKRPGTENISSIVGFAKAAELSNKEMKKESLRLVKMRDRLISSILSSVKGSYLNGHPKHRLPNNINFRFVGVEGEALLLLLDSYGIAVSTGSACSSHDLAPSHVLLAINQNPIMAHGSIRITLGRETKDSDISYVIKVIPKAVEQIRRITPNIEGVTTISE